MNEPNTIYVGIPTPDDIRKELLGASRTLLNVLKRTEVMGDIKQLKLAYSAELAKVMDDLQSQTRKLKNKLPKTPGKLDVKKPLQEPMHEEHVKSQIEMLEEELAKIEERLHAAEKE